MHNLYKTLFFCYENFIFWCSKNLFGFNSFSLSILFFCSLHFSFHFPKSIEYVGRWKTTEKILDDSCVISWFLYLIFSLSFNFKKFVSELVFFKRNLINPFLILFNFFYKNNAILMFYSFTNFHDFIVFQEYVVDFFHQWTEGSFSFFWFILKIFSLMK